MYCDTNQFPELWCCGPHTNPHGARGLSKHYHLRFYPKLGHGICAILRIPCACVACTSMIDQPWISGITSKKARHQPVTYFNYWLVLGSYKNCNIIHLTPKSTPFEVIDDTHQVVIDEISDNMDFFFQSGEYIAINTADTITNLFYVIEFISYAYKLQNNTTIDTQIISAGELVVKARYICFMKENSNWYWKQESMKHNIIVPTRIILHPCLDVVRIIDVHGIPKTVCNRIQAKKSIQRHSIFLIDTDYDYILDEI